MITIQPGFYLHVCIVSALEAYPRLFQDHSKVNYRKKNTLGQLILIHPFEIF